MKGKTFPASSGHIRILDPAEGGGKEEFDALPAPVENLHGLKGYPFLELLQFISNVYLIYISVQRDRV